MTTSSISNTVYPNCKNLGRVSKYKVVKLPNLFPLSFRRVRVGGLLFTFTLDALEDVDFYYGISIREFFVRLKSGYYDRLFEALVKVGESTIKSSTLLRYHQTAR